MDTRLQFNIERSASDIGGSVSESSCHDCEICVTSRGSVSLSEHKLSQDSENSSLGYDQDIQEVCKFDFSMIAEDVPNSESGIQKCKGAEMDSKVIKSCCFLFPDFEKLEIDNFEKSEQGKIGTHSNLSRDDE